MEKILRSNGWSLFYFPPMLVLDLSNLNLLQNWLIAEELNYDRQTLKVEVRNLINFMTSKQIGVYDTN